MALLEKQNFAGANLNHKTFEVATVLSLLEDLDILID